MKLRSGNIKDLPQSLARIQTTSRPPYLPTEVWLMVGELIHNRETLHSLVLTSHALRQVFRPILHSHHLLELSNYDPVELGNMALRPTNACTRSFEILLSEWYKKSFHHKTSNKSYVPFLVRILDSMPNLQSFRWQDDNYSNSYRPSLMMQDRRLLAALHRRKLKYLCISLQDPFPEISLDPWYDLDYFIPLRGFRNLISLEIYNIWAPPDRVDRMCQNLAESLHDNQSLRKLGLAMAAEQDHDLHPPVVALEDAKFLEAVCRYYKAKHNSKPLMLHTLLLGHKTFGFEHDADSPTDFLEYLMQPDKLEIFHVYNGYVTQFIEDEDEVPLKIDWTGLKNCKSLRQVSLARLEPDARLWLNDIGASIEELMIMDHYKRYELGLNNFGALKLPNLSMLFTREVSARDRYDDGSSFDEEIIHDVEDGGERLNGPRVYVDRALITVLDRLQDGGQNLTRLALTFDFSAQWDRFTTHLPKLTKLGYLRLCARSHKGGNYPPKTASIWSDVERPDEIALRYAKLAKSLCPSLTHVKIGRYSWEITVTNGLNVKDVDTTMQLRKLNNHEVHSIPLFATDTFTAQSGLPIIEPPERPRTGPEIKFVEIMSSIFEQAGDDVDEMNRLMRLQISGAGIPLT